MWERTSRTQWRREFLIQSSCAQLAESLFSTRWAMCNMSALPRSILQDHDSFGGSGGVRPRLQPSPGVGLHIAYWKVLAVSVQWRVPCSCSQRWKDPGAGSSFRNVTEILWFLFTRSKQTRSCLSEQVANFILWAFLQQLYHSTQTELHGLRWCIPVLIGLVHQWKQPSCWCGQWERASAFTTTLSPLPLPKPPHAAPMWLHKLRSHHGC